MKGEVEFLRRVTSWIELLVRNGERDFATLVARLPGVDPITVVAALRNLIETNPEIRYQELVDQSRSAGSPTPSRTFFPFVPHPLDFDWRFTSSCAEGIVRRLCELAEPKRVALLGTPTLIPALQIRHTIRSIKLYDRNALWKDQIAVGWSSANVTTCDLAVDHVSTDADSIADMVIMDPPWYPTMQRAYLWAAVQLVRAGGLVVSTAPPQGARPSVVAERSELRVFAEALGLVECFSAEGSVRYVTPPFEANALRAAGILRHLPDWRSGDLIAYRLRQQTTIARPEQQLGEHSWTEVQIGGVRIKVRIKSVSALQEEGSPELVSLVPGDVLPSVSARHAIREEVDVWTSGNRVFKCKNTQYLLELCNSIRHNALGMASHEVNEPRLAIEGASAAAHRAMTQVLAIVAQESNEYL